jgi:dTDP-4-amino-4,6-dideoxygalactose transaminase
MIPFLDLQAQYKTVGPEIEAAVVAILRRGDYILGKSVSEFEEKFAAFCGAKECVSVNTGTSALHLALLAAGIGPGDEVVTVSMTFVATVAAILYTGATPVFVDIDRDTLTMDPGRIEAAMTPRTKAILPVHLHGRLADMDAISAIARARGLVVIEDAAQAHGASRDGRFAGSFGDIGCFSFYPGKNLGACGEGGAIVTDNPSLAAMVRQLRDWGQAGKYNHVLQGFNYRLDTIQAAALTVKLQHLAAWTDARRKVAATYDALLAGSDAATPLPARGLEHAYHVYAVRVAERDLVQAGLKEVGIPTLIHYPKPVHLQPAYAGLGYRAGQFPVSEAYAAETLSLPIYPELTEAQANEVAAALRQACEVRDVRVA